MNLAYKTFKKVKSYINVTHYFLSIRNTATPTAPTKT